MSLALPAGRLYPLTLRAIAALLRGRTESTEAFDESLRAWEEEADVDAHLRHEVSAMGSMLDWVMASLDERRGGYRTDYWHEASRAVVLHMSWETARMIKAGRAHEAPNVQFAPLDTNERSERCGRCGLEFVHDEDVECVAAAAWGNVVVVAAAFQGRGFEVVTQALNAASDEECRAHAAEARAAIGDFGIEILDDLFRFPVFEWPRDKHPDLSQPLKQIGGDEPCPRCQANQWQEQWLRVTHPPICVTRGMHPMEKTIRAAPRTRKSTRRRRQLKSFCRRRGYVQLERAHTMQL